MAFDEALTSKSPGVVKLSDFKANLADYLGKLPTNPHGIYNIKDVIQHTQTDPREEYPSRGTNGFEYAADALDDRESDEFKAALRYMEWLANEGGVGGVLRTHNLDALVLPTCVSPIVPALGGYPIISVPLGFYPEGSELRWNSRRELITDGPGCP
jgi:amidase